jgi:hypothetical protein
MRPFVLFAIVMALTCAGCGKPEPVASPRNAAEPAGGAISPENSATDANDNALLARQVQETLANFCYRCHGQDGMVEGGFNYLMDRDQLVASKKVVPGQPDKSRLFRRVVEGEMPPEDEKPRPGSDHVALLRRWIEAGAPAFTKPSTPHKFITLADIAGSIKADLEKRNERDQPFTRYFTLTHLYNAGVSEDQIQTYRNGLAKLVNSLSWEKKVVVPEPVDPARTVLRIDLRDYRWTDREWEARPPVLP